MEPFRIHILGCGSALPTLRHNASSQVVEVRDKVLMLDCAEGTQMQLRRSHLRFTKLSHVFITHLHGDHCFGLIGMISTFGLLGRTATLHIHAPKPLGNMLQEQIDFFTHDLGYDIKFYPVDTTKRAIVYEDRSITVESIPLQHRMPTCGYLIREKQGLPHIRREMIDFYQIPTSQINNINGLPPRERRYPTSVSLSLPILHAAMPIAQTPDISPHWLKRSGEWTHFTTKAHMEKTSLSTLKNTIIPPLARQLWWHVMQG